MRICIYSDTALPKVGGQELVIDALARQFLNKGHDVSVIAPMPRPPLRPVDAELPYRVERHPRFYSTQHFVGFYRHFLQRALQRLGRQDVLHLHGLYPTGYVAALAQQTLKVPTVLTSHGGDVYQQNVRLRKPALRARHEQAVRAADRLIAISAFTRDGFLQFGADPARIIDIPNGVDAAPFQLAVPRPSDLDPAIRAGNFFLFIGRLIPRKGVDVLLRALALTPPPPPLSPPPPPTSSPADNAEVVIAGSGPERESLMALVRELGLTSRVRFVGMTAGPLKTWLFQNAVATVVPSRNWEAFGLIVLESYAAGRPVIASQHPGLADLIQPSTTGLTVPPESPEALAAALTQMRATAHTMASHVREAITQYSWSHIADRHLEVFESIRSAS